MTTAGLVGTQAPGYALDDLGGDVADASAGQPDRSRRPRGEVEHPAANERAAVVDGDDNAAAAMGDPELGAEWQAAVSRGHGFLVEALAGGSLATGLVAVERGDAREAPPRACGRADRAQLGRG